jgi:hypothetical protein
MKTFRIILLLALLALPATIAAQRSRRQPAKPKVEVPEEDPRIVQMRESTQQIVFIDSLVTDRETFMSLIPLSAHIGKLAQAANGLGTFTNEMGDHRLATREDSCIVSTDFIANRWTEPLPIEGIGSDKAVNPFLMPDGITLYFAQKGAKSIGGLDIFVTRYDSERALFLKPENAGMPFSSEANDLFFAVDEFNQLGYLVTDRRQPAGKVCIYTFIPQQTRRVYNTAAYSEQQLRSLADINSIADTWGNGMERREALERLALARSVQKTAHGTGQKSKMQTELDQMRHEADMLQQRLTLARNSYATATESQRRQMRQELLSSERLLESLQRQIRDKEKQIPYNNNN